jgi:hypothetical protein
MQPKKVLQFVRCGVYSMVHSQRANSGNNLIFLKLLKGSFDQPLASKNTLRRALTNASEPGGGRSGNDRKSRG